MNTVPLAYEDQSDPLVDQGAAVFFDGDGVLKIGDAPGLGGKRRRRDGEAGQAKKQASERQKKVRNTPRTLGAALHRRD